MNTHPSPDTLLDYIENNLSDRDRERIEYHPRSCCHCAFTVGMAQNIPPVDKLPKPPEEWIERAKRIGDRYPKKR